MPASSHPSKRVLIIGLDRLALKNLHQLNALNPEGYAFDVWVTDQTGMSIETVQKVNRPEANQCRVLKVAPLARLLQLIPFFLKNRKTYHHVEIYPGGRFAQVYLWLAKWVGLKTLIIERGDLIDFDHYPKLTRKSMQVCYRYGDWVCYREPYMLPLLQQYREDRLIFIHNAISLPERTNINYEKQYDFLWANRFVPQRYPDWVANILAGSEFKQQKAVMLGLQDSPELDPRVREKQEYVKKIKTENLQLHLHVDPVPFYLESRFFLLPADIVFCNFALIEAMGHGVVPIVTESPGAELIVDDGVDGFLSAKNPEDYKKSMEKAVQLTPQEYEIMSCNAIQKVANRFSIGKWKKNMVKLYKEIEKGTVSS